jgi:DNA-binding beta-propeller fold protein YncE
MAAAFHRLGRPAALTAGVLLVFAQVAPTPAAEDAPGEVQVDEPRVITTVAGMTEIPRVVPVAEAVLPAVSGLAVAPQDGTLYVAEATQHAIFRLAPGGRGLEHFAGTGIAGFGGDGGPALAAVFHLPTQLAVDPVSGDLLVADSQNHRVRAISRDGSRVRTVVGRGIRGMPDDRLPTLVPKGPDLAVAHFSGDGGPAEEAELNLPSGIAVDRHGNLYIADSGNHRVRVVNRQRAPIVVGGVEIRPGTIRSVAGDGADLAFPKAVGVDAAGDIWVVDAFHHRLCRIARADGRIETVAEGGGRRPEDLPGQGWSSPSIDGLAVGGDGDVFFSDLNGHALFRVAGGGKELVAGVGLPGRTADGALAAGSAISGPGALAVGSGGELYFTETVAARVRKVQAGRLEPVAGGGVRGEQGKATEGVFAVPGPLAVNAAGDLFLVDSTLRSLRVIRAANGEAATLPALARRVGRGTALAFGADGALYVADAARNQVLRVEIGSGGGEVRAVAGNGLFGFAGDGGPATAARLSGPAGLAVHPRTGELYISMLELPRVRKVDRNGVISTVAGSGEEGFAGDGGPALEAAFKWPLSLAFDRRGNLYIADFFNDRVRRVSPDGIISTFAGTGERGLAGDGGPARDARLNGPTDLAVDSRGNLLVVDSNNHCVRRIDASPPHFIHTIAGAGARGFAGDGGPAATARLNLPRGLALGADGTLFISDSLNGRIRAVRPRQEGVIGAARPRERQPS